MELKFCQFTGLKDCKGSSNRTFMELKSANFYATGGITA